MSDLVAEFVTAQVQTGDEELSRQVTDYLRQADWQLDAAGATVKRISEGLFLAQLPPISIYVLDGGHAQAVASGQLIIDGRLESDRLGLIFGLAAGGDTLQPAFVLLRRQVDGTWKPVKAAGAYGAATDTFNKLAFEPVTTDALRLEVQLQPGFSGGILEWRVR